MKKTLKFIICLFITQLFFNISNISAIDISVPIVFPPEININETTTGALDNTMTENLISSITLNQKKIRLNPGDSRQLIAHISFGTTNLLLNEAYSWTSDNNEVATVNQYGVVTGVSKGTTKIKLKGLTSKVTATCKVVVGKTKYVAFTFDDGPGKYTEKLVKKLNKYDYKATFFILGSNVKKYNEVLQFTYDSGMQIGNHSYSHANLITLKNKEIKDEIQNGSKAVSDVIGVNPTLFRPPYGNYNKIVSKYSKAPMIYWTVDFEDWANKDTKYVYKNVLSSAEDGEIILLHDIHKTTVKGFIKALPKLKKRNYELVTVNELYKIKGLELENGKMYYGPKYDSNKKKED